MVVQVGLLRAVNVGRRRVPMGRLVEVCQGLGHTGVWTYVNSGNVVFETGGGADPDRADLERGLEQALEADLGFECTTFVRTAAELEQVLAAQPFPVEPGDTHFVTFLKTAPPAADARRLESLSNDFDTLVVTGADVHWRMRGRSLETRVQKRDWEKVLGPLSSTSRNVTMLTKLNAKIAAR